MSGPFTCVGFRATIASDSANILAYVFDWRIYLDVYRLIKSSQY